MGLVQRCELSRKLTACAEHARRDGQGLWSDAVNKFSLENKDGLKQTKKGLQRPSKTAGEAAPVKGGGGAGHGGHTQECGQVPTCVHTHLCVCAHVGRRISIGEL